MESTETVAQPATQEFYNYAANLASAGEGPEKVTNALMKRGLDEASATSVAASTQQLVADARKAKAKKDMLFGALWCVGGIALTLADIGFIFWGAILFGGIQFFRGVSNL